MEVKTTICNTRAELHYYFAVHELKYSSLLFRKGEYRAEAAALDRARQHFIWSRYFRRFPNSTRNDEVG